jgi:hypothetical protein
MRLNKNLMYVRPATFAEVDGVPCPIKINLLNMCIERVSKPTYWTSNGTKAVGTRFGMLFGLKQSVTRFVPETLVFGTIAVIKNNDVIKVENTCILQLFI